LFRCFAGGGGAGKKTQKDQKEEVRESVLSSKVVDPKIFHYQSNSIKLKLDYLSSDSEEENGDTALLGDMDLGVATASVKLQKVQNFFEQSQDVSQNLYEGVLLLPPRNELWIRHFCSLSGHLLSIYTDPTKTQLV
jgi:hypothetical protein